jgi:uncharacterized membrane protein
VTGVTETGPTPVGRVAALDLLRGLAAILMVFNHVGFATLGAQDAQRGAVGAIVFLGSLAPVLFFFATGFGSGLAPRPGSWRGVLDKALLLLLADQLLCWSAGRPWGLDFFGFIALCLLAARAVMGQRRPLLAAALAIVVVVGLRYGIGPRLDAQLAGPYGPLHWLIGVTPHDNVSYPASPWLVYPLLGVALGLLYRRHGGRVGAAAWTVMAAMAVAAAAAAAAAAWLGGSFHRWGGVAAAYFALSLALLIFFLALSAVSVRHAPRLAQALSLGGVASFIVVPLHYAMVRSGWLGSGLSPAAYLAVAAAVAGLSLPLSRAFERLADRAGRSPRRLGFVVAVLVAIGVSLALAWASQAPQGSPQTLLAAATVGQLAIALLFAWRVGPFSR